MKEVLRIIHGVADGPLDSAATRKQLPLDFMRDQRGNGMQAANSTLRTSEIPTGGLVNYNLEVYERDIVYIQGLRGSGLKTLVNVLAGDCALKSGKMLLWGEETVGYNRNTAISHRIYTITAGMDLVENLTVGDNLAAIGVPSSPLKFYSRKKAEQRVQCYLQKYGLDASVHTRLWALSKLEQNKLSVLKAKLLKAELVVLDLTSDIYESREVEALCDLILTVNAEGISFVICSDNYAIFAEIATRIQVISEGRELKEWTGLTDNLRQRLRSNAYSGMFSQRSPNPNIVGLVDYERTSRDSLWQAMRTIREENRDVWDAYVGGEIPPEGESWADGTALIPRESASMLLSNLTVKQNLMLPLKNRVSNGKFGYIAPAIEDRLNREFCSYMNITQAKQIVAQLTRVQRKILSIYRWALQKPKVMILENPLSSFSAQEQEILREYLDQMQSNGIKVVFVGRSVEQFQMDCGLILTNKNGCIVRMTTK
ncbi:MAG: ATP-binding cassette domain-containing protein [Clostridiales bacterium]|nr:ATP-binding cassette domain-containing protein [Clostridiales bacterium]